MTQYPKKPIKPILSHFRINFSIVQFEQYFYEIKTNINLALEPEASYNTRSMGLMDSMKQLGDLKKMRDQAMEVQKKLGGIKITVEHKGVTVVMTGDQKVISISGDNNLEKVTDAVNEALKQSQKVAAEEMKSLMGGMMPGM